MGYISFKARIILGFGIVLFLMAGLAVFTYFTNARNEVNLVEIDTAYLPDALLASAMAKNVVDVQQFLTDVSATHDTAGYADAENAALAFKKGLQGLKTHAAGEAEFLNRLDALDHDFDKFYADGKHMADVYVKSGVEAGNQIMEEFDKTSENLTVRMEAILNEHVNDVNAHVHALTLASQFNSKVMGWTAFLSFIIGLSIALYLTRYLTQQLGVDPKDAKEIAKEIADGDFSRKIELSANDDSSLLHALVDMQQQLRVRIEREAEEKAEALRIQKALDKAESSLMMADEHYNIIYVNEALVKMFRAGQDDFRKDLPSFDVDKLLGSNIDIFHKNPAYQRSVLNAMQTTVKSSFILGGRHLDFVANSVRNEQGKRVGTVVEWADRTVEIKIEDEIKAIVEAVKSGVLDGRLTTDNKTGFLQTLSVNINELTSVIEKVFYDIASVMQSMASGDLSNRMTHDYEGIYDSCKNDINATLDKLSEVFTQIRDAASYISHSSDEIASGNNNLSQRAEQQAANLQQTASSMEELTSTVKNNAENAREANHVATVARELAEHGGKVVDSAINAMQEINESSTKIAAIIGVIDEIAFQTNLLALNASVEAARAGENGRGFSVVATEVRNLAQRSANAARESKLLIQNSIQKVRNGTEFVNETGKSLNEIVGGVKQVSSIIAQIASASAQQSAGIEQVNLAVAQMDEITQQNAALAEQAAAASVSMNDQTANMRDLLAFFHLNAEAASVSRTTPLRPTAGNTKNLNNETRGKKSLEKPVSPSVIVASNATDDSEWDEF